MGNPVTVEFANVFGYLIITIPEPPVFAPFGPPPEPPPPLLILPANHVGFAGGPDPPPPPPMPPHPTRETGPDE